MPTVNHLCVSMVIFLSSQLSIMTIVIPISSQYRHIPKIFCLVGFVDKLLEGINTDIELVTSEMNELWVMNLRRFIPILVYIHILFFFSWGDGIH